MTDQLKLAAKALRTTSTELSWVHPTDEELEVAELLDEIAELHAAVDGQICPGCAQRFPCVGWLHGQQLATQWLGRAAQRVYERTRKAVRHG